MSVTLVEDGEAEATIRYWSNDGTVAEFAAREFQSYVEEMSGARLPVETVTDEIIGDEATIPAAIFVGPSGGGTPESSETDSALSSQLKAVTDQLGAVPDDAFALQVDDGIVLAGTTPQGTLYAVYSLLERLGVEFFAPEFEFYENHHEDIPTHETIEVPDIETVEAPDLTYRRKHVEAGWSFTADTLQSLVDWMAKTRHNVLVCPADFSNVDSGFVTWDRWRDDLIPELEKRGILLEVGGHGFDSFLPPEEFADDHPDWFVDDHNVFDVTVDDAVDTYIENVVEYLDERPEIDIFDAWPPDGASWPPAVTKTFGSVSDAYAHVVTELEAAIDEAFPDRDIVVEAIAYASHIDTPETERMYPDSVLIDFAPIGRGFSTPINDKETEANWQYADLLETWRDEFDGSLVVYEYYRRYAWHSLPVIFPQTVGQDLAFYTRTGVDGLGMYAEPADWLTYELTHLLVGATSWDADLDLETWLTDYLEARFGTVADLAEEYVDHVVAAAEQRFDPGRVNESEDEAELLGALESYQAARDVIATAQERAKEGSAAAFMCRRLKANTEYAIADTEISYYELRDDEEAVSTAREQTRELANRHAFDGIILDSQWTLQRYDEDQSAGIGLSDPERDLFKMYNHQW